MTDWLIPLVGAGAVGLPQPLTKLIEVLADGAGVRNEPTRIVKKAEAEAKAAIIKAKASEDVKDMKALRTIERVEWKELRRQGNIESVAKIAYDNLPDKVSEEKVDEDWTVQFFNYSQDVSNEEMQMIWGKILAGEVSQPGSFSLRTLSIVKILNQEDALLFKKICNYAWGGFTIIYCSSIEEYFNKVGLPWASFLHLGTLGLINTADTNLLIKHKESENLEYLGDKYIFTNNNPLGKALPLQVYLLTQIGMELFSICDKEPDLEYLSILLNYFSQDGSVISMRKM